MNGLAWPDLVVLAVVAFGALRGFKRGLVKELTGLVALAIGIAALFLYRGQWDALVHAWTHLPFDGAHVVGMLLFAFAAYLVVRAVGGVLNAVAKLPLIGLANALGGGVAGAVKAAAFAWVVVYVALFFPLPDGLRRDLHASRAVAALEAPNGAFDGMLQATLPWFVRPYASDMFARHRV